jgi:hypothetical protein
MASVIEWCHTVQNPCSGGWEIRIHADLHSGNKKPHPNLAANEPTEIEFGFDPRAKPRRTLKARPVACSTDVVWVERCVGVTEMGKGELRHTCGRRPKEAVRVFWVKEIILGTSIIRWVE